MLIAEGKKIEKGKQGKRKIRIPMTTALEHFHLFIYAYMLHRVISQKNSWLGTHLALRPRRRR